MDKRSAFLWAAGLACSLVVSCADSRSAGGDDADDGGGNSHLDPSHLQGHDGGDPSSRDGGRDSGTSDGGGSSVLRDAAPGDRDAGPANGSDGGAGSGSAGTDDSDAGPLGCELRANFFVDFGTRRCGDAGRERCDGSSWVADPCPLDQPACRDGQCELRGPSMVHVGAFYIDSTEVTVANYQTFLDAKAGDTSGQPAFCSWNDEFFDGTPSNSDNWPITSVDFCDAWAYCNWAGKRLCGALEGGAVADADALDPAKSQWSLACGGANAWTHPNANPDCNSNGGFGTLAEVGSTAGCEGFNTGLFDMEGNAAEWVDACDTDTGASDTCHLLGGSYIDNQSYCTESFDYPRDTTAEPFGFRCCSG